MVPQRSTDPAETLEAIGQRLLDIILAPDALARFRVVMAESARFPELANIYYRTGPERVTAGLAAYLATLHERKLLRVPDPLVAASQFFGMVRGNLFIRGLLRIEPLPSADDCAVSPARPSAPSSLLTSRKKRIGPGVRQMMGKDDVVLASAMAPVEAIR
jgi:hypothetical protein